MTRKDAKSIRNTMREDTSDTIEVRLLSKHDNERAPGTCYIYAAEVRKHDLEDGDMVIVSYDGVPTIAKVKNMARQSNKKNEWRLYLTSNFTRLLGLEAKDRFKMNHHGIVGKMDD